MDDAAYAFLEDLLLAPGVSGAERAVAAVVRRRMGPFADRISTDVHGNTTVALNPAGQVRVMLAGHVDQVGLMVKHVADDGFLSFDTVGGVDPGVLPGSRVTVWGTAGPVAGVIGRKPIHLMTPAERAGGKIDPAKLWIDLGAADRAAALARVAVADPVTFAAGVTRLGEDRIAGPALDDRVGVWVVMEAVRRCHARRGELRAGLFGVATVAEEIGGRGATTAAFGIDPRVGIAVDVCHATDHPGADAIRDGDVRLGGGPVIPVGPNVNPAVRRLLVAAAGGRPHQRHVAPGASPSDASPMQVTRSGMAVGLVVLPNRYMHTPVEVCSLADLDAAAELLATFVLAVGPETDFTPG